MHELMSDIPYPPARTGHASGERAPGGRLFGSAGEYPGLWQSGQWQDAAVVRHRSGADLRRVLFRPCSLLVQELLLAKREWSLPRLLKRLSKYEALLIDDST